MSDADRIRPTRLLVLVGLLGLIFLLLLALAAARFGPGLIEALRGAFGARVGVALATLPACPR
ncbi:MAG: hypothetical protein ABEH40_06465 [Haloferacaceae archaeon]